MRLTRYTLPVLLSLSCVSHGFGMSDLKHGEIPIQLGMFVSNSGLAQHVNIKGLIGNQYTNSSRRTENALVGAGYFIKGLNKESVDLRYGINAFYLATTTVTGHVVQENLFSNLAYQYSIQNAPVYFAAKANIKTSHKPYSLILDAGLGPNFIAVNHYKETSLDRTAVPDNAFLSHSNVAFSATVGIGVRLENVFGKAPLECGYRLFYLGQGSLTPRTNQIQNTLATSENYANAIVCSVTV